MDAYKSYDMSDAVWEMLAPHLPGQQGQWGGVAEDNRRFLDGVFWILRTGEPWRNLPECYGKWNSVAKRFQRWRLTRTWDKLLELLIDEPGFEWLLLGTDRAESAAMPRDATAGERDSEQTVSDDAHRCAWPWLRMITPSEYLMRQIPKRIGTAGKSVCLSPTSDQ